MVSALRCLYTDMAASVSLWAGVDSRSFKIERGVRQGDPLSPLLFNMLLDQVLEEVRVIWRRRGYGTNVGQNGTQKLTHIAFADDMTLVSRSWISLKRMIALLRAALLKRGLRLHPSKCKVQTNSDNCQVRGQAQIDNDFCVEILPQGDVLKFLGTDVDLSDASGAAIQNRIDAAWRCFWSLKQLLLNRKVSVNRRLKLFDATVSSVALYCCQSWTPRAEEFRKLEVTRRSMLRRIVGTRRGSEESWLEWMVRVTRKAVDMASSQHVRQWQHAHLKSKWQWAGHVARRPDTSWLWRVTVWRDQEWQSFFTDLGMARPLRPSRRRWMRWADPVYNFCKQQGLGEWMQASQDKERWNVLTEGFALSFK